MGDQLLRLHALFFCGGGERGEVYVGGDVLFARGFVGIGADRVLTEGLQGAAMPSSQLLFASVAVVDGKEEAVLDAGRDAIHELLRRDGRFEAFARVGMDRVAVEECEFLGRGWRPGFDESAVARVDAQGSACAEDFDREGVEEFVCENDDRNLWS